MEKKIALKHDIKNVLIIGDSYSTFKGFIPEGFAVYYTGAGECGITSATDCWWHKFGEKTGATVVRNDSWSGSTVCYTGRETPEYAYNSSFVNRMHKLIDEGFFENKKIDTVLIFGGTNDSWLETTPKGEIQLSDWREEDLYFSLPAICYMASRLRAVLPEGNVIFIINTELDERISGAIKLACEHFGTDYVALSDIDKKNGHPTPRGMTEICEQLIAAIE